MGRVKVRERTLDLRDGKGQRGILTRRRECVPGRGPLKEERKTAEQVHYQAFN